MSTQFGDFFHEKRIATGLTLRKFCLRHGLDPGNLSKLERGILPPPASRDKLVQYATYLGIRPGTDDWLEFFDRAAAGRGRFPDDVMCDEELVKKLPVLFRTMRGDQIKGGVLPDGVDVVRKTHSAE